MADGTHRYGACFDCDNLRDYGNVCAEGLKLYPSECPSFRAMGTVPAEEPASLPHWIDEPNG